MATTGFWPIKGKLADLIDYVQNPEKTGELGDLDKDLYAAIQYVGDLEKTDRAIYVDSLNCPVVTAYEHMITTKRRFGKLSGNVAYHGYQSFVAGEVTPEEALKIGRQTAYEMWGDRFEVLIGVHLNTDNIHCHFLVNSVSFKDGRKFENHISDHRRLRDISDRICFEHGKSFLKDARFYSKGNRKEYWVHKSGGMTHRDILRRDIDEAIANTISVKTFDAYMEKLGYSYVRSREYRYPSIMAEGWKRPVRVENLGPEYTWERIDERLAESRQVIPIYAVTYPKRQTPLLSMEAEYNRLKRMNGMQLAFEIILSLLKLASGAQGKPDAPRPLSPAMRQEVRKLDETLKQYELLCVNHIDSPEELLSFVKEKSSAIAALEDERQKLYNRCRHPKSEDDKKQFQAQARDISARLKPLRDELATAKAIVNRYPKLLELLETERTMETELLTKNKKRSYER